MVVVTEVNAGIDALIDAIIDEDSKRQISEMNRTIIDKFKDSVENENTLVMIGVKELTVQLEGTISFLIECMANRAISYIRSISDEELESIGFLNFDGDIFAKSYQTYSHIHSRFAGGLVKILEEDLNSYSFKRTDNEFWIGFVQGFYFSKKHSDNYVLRAINRAFPILSSKRRTGKSKSKQTGVKPATEEYAADNEYLTDRRIINLNERYGHKFAARLARMSKDPFLPARFYEVVDGDIYSRYLGICSKAGIDSEAEALPQNARIKREIVRSAKLLLAYINRSWGFSGERYYPLLSEISNLYGENSKV